jgi:hypothetical protein
MANPPNNNRPVKKPPATPMAQSRPKAPQTKAAKPAAQTPPKTKTVPAPGQPASKSTSSAKAQTNPNQTEPPQQPSANAAKPSTVPNGSALFNSFLGQLGIKSGRTLTDEQNKALTFAESMMAKDKFGGVDGRFNQDDVNAIAASVAKDSKGITPLVLSQTKTKQEYNVAKAFLTDGVSGPSPQKEILQVAQDRITTQVSDMVKGQMSKTLDKQGIGGTGNPDDTPRTVGIQDLAQFEASMKVIQGIQEGSKLPGMKVTLPEGPSAKTFQDLSNGVLKPEGVNVAFGSPENRPAGTASAELSKPSQGANANVPESAKPLSELLKEAEGKMNDPKPSALPKDVQEALKVVIPQLGKKGLGGNDLTFNHADLNAIGASLSFLTRGTAVSTLTDNLNTNGINGGKAGPADTAQRALSVFALNDFGNAMKVIQAYGEEQAKINGFRIKPPTQGIPQQMFLDLQAEKVPQFGVIEPLKK